jgi:CheY-like chemotaxis protein
MSCRILYIEDNLHSIELVRRMLTKEGYEVLCAANGEQGLDIAYQERPDLIITDIRMPTMSGIEVAEHIRSNPDLQHIPIIALTAQTMHGDKEAYLRKGFNAYVAKPIMRPEFLGVIRKVLNR